MSAMWNRIFPAILAIAACKGSTSSKDKAKVSPAMATPADAAVADAPVAEAAPPAEAKHVSPPGCLFEPPKPVPTSCPAVTCGNSASINNSIVEALDTEGKEVQTLAKPFKLERGTLQGATGGCAGQSNVSLEVRDGGFVGVVGEGAAATVKCTGTALKGAKFTVTQLVPTDPNARTKFVVRIDKIGSIGTWSETPSAQQKLPTYDLVEESHTPGVGHLCPGEAWGDSFAQLPPHLKPWLKNSFEAVLVQGETYKADGTIGKTGERWFNIGCAGSAIAKMRLLGFDPMKPTAGGSPANSADNRQATLKMFTAKYCGADSWTKNGTRIAIRATSAAPPPPPGPGSGERIGPVESQWGPNGALCISHLRLWSEGSPCAKSDEAAAVETIRAACGIKACPETDSCTTASAESADPNSVWRTCTVNHIKHGSL